MNNEFQRNDSTNGNTVKTVIITILVMIVLGLVAFLVWDKVISKDNDVNNTENNNSNNAEVVALDINSDLVKGLKVPYFSEKTSSYYYIGLSNFKVATGTMPYIRDLVFHQLLLNGTNSSPVERDFPYFSECGSYYYIKMSEMKDKFTEIFGPDVEYTDGQGEITYNRNRVDRFYYNSSDSRYYYEACGYGGDEGFYGSKIYKAEQKNDEIYIYMVVYSSNEVDHKLYDVATDNYLGIYEDETTIDKLIGENKFETYKFTFKKQSDGKYYVYSGEWM